MVPQFKNRLISSYLLWLDHWVLDKGRGFTNHGSYFYPTTQTYSNFYTYSAPFGQFVSDTSISGANVPTGVYLDGVAITTGQSGFLGINYAKGQCYFSTPIAGNNRISGSYAVKDFNIYLTDQPEAKLLFETKHSLRPKTYQTVTGLATDEKSIPAIFLKPNGGENKEFAFGGMDNTILRLSAVVFADSQFNLDAILSMLEDSARSSVPILTEEEMPYNKYGSFKSGSFPYTGLVAGKYEAGETAFVSKVVTNEFDAQLFTEIKTLNPDVYFSLVDITLEKPRFPRI
jgi:hypothetical protein